MENLNINQILNGDDNNYNNNPKKKLTIKTKFDDFFYICFF